MYMVDLCGKEGGGESPRSTMADQVIDFYGMSSLYHASKEKCRMIT